MTGPAMRALGQRARVTLLTSPAGATVAELMPELDETIVYAAAWMKAPPPGAPHRALGEPELELTERLRGYRFDAAANFTVYSQSACRRPCFVCWRAFLCGSHTAVTIPTRF